MARYAKMNDAGVEVESIVVEHKFTEEEIDTLNNELVAFTIEAAEQEESMKKVASEQRTKLNSLELQRNQRAAALRRGCEERMKECTVERDYKRGIIRYIDPDTFKVAKERPMTRDERDQPQLPLGQGVEG